MKTSHRSSYLPFFAFLALTTATNLQLTSVQPIVGFSQTCAGAYSQVLPSCSLDDLLASVGGKNGGCSVSCVSELTAAQLEVQASCQGERASRQTVIGQMFLGTIVQFVCGDGVGGGNGGAQTTAQTTPLSTMSTATPTMSTAAPVGSTTASTTTTNAANTQSPTQTQTTANVPPAATNSNNNNNNNAGNGEDGTLTNFDGSGGGSPFDGGAGEFDGAAGQLSPSGSFVALFAAFAALLFIR